MRVNPKVGKKLTEWDEYGIQKAEIEYRINNIEEFDYLIDGFTDEGGATGAELFVEAGENGKKFIKLLKKYGFYENFEKYVEQKVYDDSDLLNINWDSFAEYLTEILEKKSPDGYWKANMEGFGWRGQSGEKVLYAKDGQDFIRQILPQTDCTFYIYNYGKGIAINNFHHDAPTGKEWYYCLPISEETYEEERID